MKAIIEKATDSFPGLMLFDIHVEDGRCFRDLTVGQVTYLAAVNGLDIEPITKPETNHPTHLPRDS